MTGILDSKLQDAWACMQARDAAGAERACGEILQQSPGHPEALHLLGLAYTVQGRSGEAVEAFRQVLVADPDNPGVHLNLGNALATAGMAEEALACYRRALTLDPGLVAAHFNQGRQFERMGRLEQARDAYQAVLAVSPGHVDALHSLGAVLSRLGQTEAAVSCYRGLLEREPGHAPTLNNLGNLHTDQGQYAEACTLYQKALELDPGNCAARIDLGTAYSAQHAWDAAAAQYEKALELDPALPDAQYNLGLVRLFQHEFEEGWRGYEHRLGCPEVRRGLRKGAPTLQLYERLPRWKGPVAEPRQEVAIWSEQGIGDQILFSTLIPDLIASETRFVYEVDRRLLPAYERAFPGVRFVALEKSPQAPLKLTDRVLLAGSLPGYFRPSPESFSRQPRRLLGAQPQRVARYREALAARGPGLKVALSWKSKNPRVRFGPGKSVPLREFSPLLRLPGAHFVDVQYGDTAAEREALEKTAGTQLPRCGDADYYDDLEELMAVLEACDLLITTSNATAHLAGALGKRTWLLFLADRAPFYYWSHGGSHRSLWYPEVEIVTGPQFGEWEMLIEHVARKLEQETA